MTSRGIPLLVILCGAMPLSALGDQVDDYVKDQMKRRNITGAAVGIMHRGKEVKASAYGLANIELNVPVSKESAFEVGGITTQFTAAAILLLVQEGRISLDDSITLWLKQSPSKWSNITIRHLLYNTSGIKSFTSAKGGFELTRRLTQAQFVDAIGALPLEGKPGDKAVYSASGYCLLGFIVESVSGKSYWAFIEERIFQPTGMTASGNRDPLMVVKNRVSGYETTTGGTLINRDYDLTDMFSAGALRTSIMDLMKWDATLDSERVLTSASKTLMTTAGTTSTGKRHDFGFGCRIDTQGVFVRISQTGSTSGFSSSYQRYPEIGLSIVVLTNTTDEPGKRAIALDMSHQIASFYLK